MANPQCENGYIRIATEIAEALMKTNLTKYQSRFLWVLWAKTYGWNKKEDWISNSQISEMTGIKPSHISRAKSELTKRGIIITPNGNKVAFNKDWSQWKELPNGVKRHDVTKRGHNNTKRGIKKYQTGGTQKKAYIQKKKNIEFILPEWVSLKTWSDFLEHRKKVKAPMSDIAQERALKALEKLKAEGHDPEKVIDQSIVMGWKGLFPIKQDKNNEDTPENWKYER